MSVLGNVADGSADTESARPVPASVLVIDDEPGICQMVTAILRAKAYEVTAAQSGQEALEWRRRQQYDVVITDLAMPEMDGIQTLTALKEIDPDLEAIVITGRGSMESATLALKHGACDILAKPFGQAELSASVAHALELRRLKLMLALYESTRALFSAGDAQGVIAAILGIAQRELRARAAALALGSRPGESLELRITPDDTAVPKAAIRHCAERAMGARDSIYVGGSGGKLPPLDAFSGSFLAYPLRVRDTLLGSLVLWRDPQNPPFRPFELYAGKVLANEAAMALEGARVHSELTRQVQQLEAAHSQLARADAQARRIVETALDAIILFDKDGWIRDLNPKALEMFGRSREQTVGKHLADFAIPQRFLGAFQNHLEHAWREGKDPAKGCVQVIALRQNGEEFPLEISTVVIETPQGKLLSTFARDAMAERHRLATLVADVGMALAGAETMRQGLQRCAEILVRDISAAFARIWTTNEEEKLLELQASAGMYTHLDGGHARVPVGKFKIGRIAETGEAHLTNTVLEDDWVGDREWARREGMVAFAGYPLKVQGRVLGVVASFARRPLTEATLQTFASVADNLAQFIKRKAAEKALSESEDRYRDLVENTFLLLGTHDAQGRFLSLNRAAATLLQAASAEELVGRPLTDFVPPALLPQFDQYLETILQKGHAEGLMVLAVPGGATKIVEYRKTLRQQGSSEPIIRWTGQDVTERSKAQEAQAFLASIVESSHDAIIGKTLDGKIVSWNHGAEELYGYSAEKMIKKSISALTLPSRSDELPQLLEKIRQGQRITGYETVRVRKDGTSVDVSLTISPVRNAQGVVTGAATIARDITERRRAEEQMRLQTAALESAANGISITDPSGRFIWVNPAFTRLTGYSSTEIVGRNARVLKSGLQDAAFYQRLWSTILSGQVWQGELVNRRKDGTLYTEEMTITPVRNEEASISHLIAIKQDITERKQREQALWANENQLRAILDNSTAIIYLKDRAGRYIRTNRAFETLLGIQPGQAVGKTDLELFPKEVAEAFRQNDQKVLQAKAPLEFEEIDEHKGGIHTYLSVKFPLFDAFGAPYAIAGISTDITARKQAEQQAHLLTTALESAANGVLIADRGGRIVWVNPAFTRLSGYSTEEVVGQTPRVWKSGTHDAAFYRKLWESVLAGEVWQGEIVNRRKDGTLYTEGMTVTPVRDATGTVSHFIAIKQDISDRKRAEQALRESEQRYRELFLNASDIVYTTDLSGRFTSLNRVGQQTLGYSEEEATQLSLWEVVAPKHQEMAKQGRARLLAGESYLTAEVEMVVKDGRRVTLELKPRVIYKDGKPVGVQAIARDITGRDAAEMELRHAQKLESVGRLAAGIAHEINTPIQFVGDNTRFLLDSFTQLQTLLRKYQELRDAAATGAAVPELVAEAHRVEAETDCPYLLEEIPKALTQTLDGVTRVATIVRAMKEFAHPEAKSTAAADLNKALLSTLTVARNELKYVADVETEFGELPLVVCNISDLNQVFLNLLVNAAHAIEEVVRGTGQKGKIRVRTVPEGNSVLISISDTGCGIPEANRARVFDPFFTTKEVGRGTGQGLAISRSVVVDRHKGSLTFETEVGKGTTFFIRLPLDFGDSYREANRS